MKKIYLFCCFVLTGFFSSCEEVIPLDLDTAPPKLVIEAAINWKKGTAGTIQKIKLSTTTSYYTTTPIKVSGATVFIKNSANAIFTFTEITNTGEYQCDTFIPVRNETYTLTIINEGNTYTASEKMQSVTPITRVERNDKGGFSGKEIQLKTYFDDPADETNYYLFQHSISKVVKPNFYVIEDTFFNGNPFFSSSRNLKLEVGDKVEIIHYGISKTYYNYLRILLDISDNSGGSPFQTPSATVRGNVVNTTKSDNFPLGYFSLSEYDSINYTVE